MKPRQKRILAFDIGGTKIASGIVEISKTAYNIYDYQKIETPKSKEGVIQKVIELIVYYGKNSGFKSVGIGLAGQINYKKGIVDYLPNVNGFRNVNLRKIIKETVGEEVKIDNDVKCFALAENAFGKANKYKSVVYLTIGTGIGGAIEIGDSLYRGANNTAGEFGHMIVVPEGRKCSCGSKGCWEQYASGRAMEKLYYELYGKRKKARDIALDSIRGIKKDKNVIRQVSHWLAIGFVNIINTINPEIVVVGGSVMNQKEILDLAVSETRKKVLPTAKDTKVVLSSIGDEAILVGAALL